MGSLQKALFLCEADMDFKAAECILAAIRELFEHGVFGYYGNKKPMMRLQKLVQNKAWVGNRRKLYIGRTWPGIGDWSLSKHF